MTLRPRDSIPAAPKRRPAHAKVVIVGAGEAGKSTLIALLCEGAINLAAAGRTVAMDHGTLPDGERSISLVGMPGQPRFREVRQALVVAARCAVWVHRVGGEIDVETVDLLTACGIPYLVILNLEESQAAIPWAQPEGLRPPHAILRGDLVQLAAEKIERWKTAIRELAASSQSREAAS